MSGVMTLFVKMAILDMDVDFFLGAPRLIRERLTQVHGEQTSSGTPGTEQTSLPISSSFRQCDSKVQLGLLQHLLSLCPRCPSLQHYDGGLNVTTCLFESSVGGGVIGAGG